MIEKNLIIAGIQEQIDSTTDVNIKNALRQVIIDIISDKYNIRVWE